MLAKDLIVEKKQYKNYSIKPVAVLSVNTREWILLDLACAIYGLTLVPIYDTLGKEAMEVMFEETELPTIFLSTKHIKAMVEKTNNGDFPFLKNFVVMDEQNLTPEIEAIFGDISWFRISDLIETGAKDVKPYVDVKPDDISFFSYTSGTTGRPKGAMITHANLVAGIASVDYKLPKIDIVHLSYLPLAHVFERLVYALVTFRGG